MMLGGANEMGVLVSTMEHVQTSVESLLWQAPVDWTILAQQFDQDILGDLQKAFGNFVDSGQVWALLIGVIVGYFFKSITT